MIRELTAAEFLSGRTVLHSVIGRGMNSSCKMIEDGVPVLSEDVTISFSNGESRKFYKTDNVSMEFVYEEIRTQMDYLNTGSNLRPIYSPPSGHTNKDKNITHATVFTYELESLIKEKARLPFYLYVNNSGKKDGHICILARNVQITIGPNQYLTFEKDKCTVNEILAICRDSADKLSAEKGIDESITNSLPTGFIEKKPDGTLEYELVDILEGKATLPIKVYAEFTRITEDILIKIGNKQYAHKRGELLSDVEHWKDGLSRRNSLAYGYIVDRDITVPKTFRIQDLTGDKATLPVVNGYVLGEDIIVRFLDLSEKIYRRNALFSEVWNDISTLYIMSKVEEFGYPNPVGPKIFQRVLQNSRFDVITEEESSPSDVSLLFGYKDHVRSVVVLKDITEEADIAERFNKVITESELLTQKIEAIRRR